MPELSWPRAMVFTRTTFHEDGMQSHEIELEIKIIWFSQVWKSVVATAVSIPDMG